MCWRRLFRTKLFQGNSSFHSGACLLAIRRVKRPDFPYELRGALPQISKLGSERAGLFKLGGKFPTWICRLRDKDVMQAGG